MIITTFHFNDLAGSMSDLERRRRNRATSGLNRNIARPSRGRVLTSMSSSSNLSERLDRAQSASNMTSSQGSSEAMMETTGSRPPIWSRSHTRSPKPGSNNSMVADTGRTIEQVLLNYMSKTAFFVILYSIFRVEISLLSWTEI